jgi:hypothetical protein
MQFGAPSVCQACHRAARTPFEFRRRRRALCAPTRSVIEVALALGPAWLRTAWHTKIRHGC